MENKLNKLDKLMSWVQKNTIKPEDLKLFIESAGKLFRENVAEIQTVKNQYKNDYLEVSQSLQNETKELKKIAEKNTEKTTELERDILALDDKIESIEIPEIPEVDFDKIKKEILDEVPEVKEIVDEINNLPEIPEYQIDAKHIKNLPQAQTIYGNRGRRGIYQVNNSSVRVSDVAKAINFTGTAVSSVTEANDTVTVSLASGGSPLSGNPTSVGFFNGTGNDLETNAGYFDYDNSGFFLQLLGENFTETGSLYTGIQGGYTIQRNENLVAGVASRYVIASPVTFASGLSAEIGSLGTNGVDFLLKESSNNLGWAIPSTTRFVQTADKTIANSNAETTIIGTGVGTLEFPANYFTVGKTIKIHIRGFHSSIANPLITLAIKLNSTTIVTDAVASGNGTNDGFLIDADITFRTVGATGTVSVGGHYQETHNSGSSIGLVQAGTTTIDTTIAQTLDVTWTWNVADIRNTVTSQATLVEVIKAF